MTRPFVTHEQQIYGSLATADVLGALDTPLLDGTMDWNALAPMASLMSAGDVLVQYDEAYERYDTANPQQVAQDLAVTPPGLSDPVAYGTPRPNVPLVPHFDEATLARPPNQEWPSPLVSYTVADPRPIVRTEPTTDPLVVDGDASGVVAAASVGLLAGNPAILYAGTLDTMPGFQKATLGAPANLVVTDTNRKQADRVEHPLREHRRDRNRHTTPDPNPSNEPLNLFPKAPSDAQSTATYSGIASVDASSYGSSITYLPEDRPYNAIDGNPQTAWEDNSFATPAGQWWQVALLHPTTETLDHPHPAPDRRPRPVDLEGQTDLRRPRPDHRPARCGLTHLPPGRRSRFRRAPSPPCGSPSKACTWTTRRCRSPLAARSASPRSRSPESRPTRSSRCPRTSCALPVPPRPPIG